MKRALLFFTCGSVYSPPSWPWWNPARPSAGVPSEQWTPSSALWKGMVFPALVIWTFKIITEACTYCSAKLYSPGRYYTMSYPRNVRQSDCREWEAASRGEFCRRPSLISLWNFSGTPQWKLYWGLREVPLCHSGSLCWRRPQDSHYEINEHNFNLFLSRPAWQVLKNAPNGVTTSGGGRAHHWDTGTAGFANLYVYTLTVFFICDKAEQLLCVPWLCWQSSRWWMTIRGFCLWKAKTHTESRLNTFHNIQWAQYWVCMCFVLFVCLFVFRVQFPHSHNSLCDSWS